MINNKVWRIGKKGDLDRKKDVRMITKKGLIISPQLSLLHVLVQPCNPPSTHQNWTNQKRSICNEGCSHCKGEWPCYLSLEYPSLLSTSAQKGCFFLWISRVAIIFGANWPLVFRLPTRWKTSPLLLHRKSSGWLFLVKSVRRARIGRGNFWVYSC